jgi:hypothetical protein
MASTTVFVRLGASATPVGKLIFDKIKTWTRRVAHRAINALQDAGCDAIDDVYYNQAATCFPAAGYEPD